MGEPARSEPANAVSVQAPLNEVLVGQSPAIANVREMLGRLASADITVLITGESGTGKDIAARMLHKQSGRSGRPFVKVNCPAIPESILESELFGYERGAFTGARNSKPGRFELANHGTIFLDEIAETSPTVQGKLLQVLDGEPFMRIGGVTPIQVDVRVIAATNVNLEEAVRNGAMREDIYFRLSEVIVRMPSLRERPEDVPLLAEHFNFNYCERLGRAYEPLPADYVRQMQRLPWPGNVRELGGSVKKYVATGDPELLLGDTVELAAEAVPEAPQVVPAAAAATQPSQASAPQPRKFPSLKEVAQRAVEEAEKALLEDVLRYTLWNRRRAAKLLGISYSSLLRRIDAYNLGKSGKHEE
ncbi:MAG: sigma-54 dependent transcriptional regulator [Candidatus Hydrogenedentes bacterium]|nr:sigma-54 dependent transcriptional regulator [Candidatus Hydrogenedentota bacterium]